MSFDWGEYLALARRLAEESDDASRRSAISRAYYSVYHAARSYLEETHEFRASADNPLHKQLWDQYRKKGRTYNAVGINGDRLRLWRTQADYDSEIQDLSSLLDESLEKVDNVFEYLNTLKKAQP